MARTLSATVHGLRDPETGQVVSFRKGDTVPKWAADQITNPAAWGEVAVQAEADDGGPVPSGPPSRNQPKADWVDYAISQGMGFEAADNLTKQDLVDRYAG